jgi:hypothetical protein
MSTFDFSLVLTGFSELTDEVMNALYEAGSDDGLVYLTQVGTPFIDFDRDATNLQSAFRSAIADVRKTRATECANRDALNVYPRIHQGGPFSFADAIADDVMPNWSSGCALDGFPMARRIDESRSRKELRRFY